MILGLWFEARFKDGVPVDTKLVDPPALESDEYVKLGIGPCDPADLDPRVKRFHENWGFDLEKPKK